MLVGHIVSAVVLMGMPFYYVALLMIPTIPTFWEFLFLKFFTTYEKFFCKTSGSLVTYISFSDTSSNSNPIWSGLHPFFFFWKVKWTTLKEREREESVTVKHIRREF